MTDVALTGRDLRALRISRKLTLKDVARRLNRSVGWLSQVERGISAPGADILREIAQLFDVPFSLLVGPATTPTHETGLVVRASARRVIGTQEGLDESLVSPDLTDSFEVVHAIFRPGSSRVSPVTRPTQEVAYVISGQLDIWLGDAAFSVGKGDSFRVRGQSFRWANPYANPATAIWVISPPVY